MKKRSSVVLITQGALIASVYLCLSVMPGINALSYGPIQFRISEALVMLCLISPSAVFGVSLGCFLSNLFSPFGANVFDLLLGTTATLLAGIVTYFLRKFFLKSKVNLFLSPLPPIIFNALIVGTYLPFVTGTFENLISVLYCILSVGAGELLVLYILGIPLYIISSKNKLLKNRTR